MSCSFSNSTCFSPPFSTNDSHNETTFRNSILKWGNNRTPRTILSNTSAQELSFLDQPYPEPQLLKIECERLRLNRPFVKADRDPANMGMGFAPSALRRRSTAFVDITSLRAFKSSPDPERSLTPFKMHSKSPNFS